MFGGAGHLMLRTRLFQDVNTPSIFPRLRYRLKGSFSQGFKDSEGTGWGE